MLLDNKFIVVVDMQNDFVTGSLGTKEAEAIIPNIVRKISRSSSSVLVTMDTHESNYLDTQEGQLLPVTHCVKGTPGWELVPEIEEVIKDKNPKCFEKETFGSVKLAEYLQQIHKMNPIQLIELVGVCTDICVISNALLLKAFLPTVPIYVKASCCAGTSIEKHNAAIEVMKSCQVLIKN